MAAVDIFRREPDVIPLHEEEFRNDACSKDGALRLKEKIEAYWLARGHAIQVTPVHVGFVPVMRSARTDLRSNLVDGPPPALRSANEQ